MLRLVVCFIVVIQGCVIPFEVELENKRFLVVEGLITNQEGPYEVILSYSYNSGSPDLASGATVIVKDGGGVEYLFTEQETGHYFSPPGLSGEIGETYELLLEINGEVYQSHPEALIAAPPVDSLYFTITKNTEGEQALKGIQFLVASHDEALSAQWYKYQWEATYEINVPLPATHVVINSEIVPIGYRPSPCYETLSSSRVFVEQATNTSLGYRVVDFPLNFIPEGSFEIRSKYSLKVSQFTLSKRAFDFFDQVRKSNENSGTLFDSQQGSVPGNVYADSGEPVLGYFQVSGVSEKREFFTASGDFKELSLPKYPYYCGPGVIIDCVPSELEDCDSLTTTPTEAIRLVEENPEWHFQIWDFDEDSPFPYANLHQKPCTDCTHLGSIEVPDFWQ